MSSFYFTKAGYVIPMCTGTISLLSSALVLWVIVRSRVYTTYHQIICFMSSWDVVLSLSIGLTSIPMPKDVLYPFQGPVYGNTFTCEAQAFAFLLGSGFTLSSNMFLNIYYLCTIRYNVEEKKFRKYAWPLFLLFSTVLTLWMSMQLLITGSLNPTPYESFCIVGTYPVSCNAHDIPCIRGSLSPYMQYYFSMYVYTFVGIQVVILFVSMILIVYTFHTKSRDWRRRGYVQNQTNDEQFKESMTRAITKQALMYILAFMLTWSFTIVSFFKDTTEIAIAKQIFQPLQGFFNAAIFVYHKVYIIRRCDQDLSIREALYQVLIRPGEEPRLYISRLSMVEGDVQLDVFNRRLHVARNPILVEENMNESSGFSERDADVDAASGGLMGRFSTVMMSAVATSKEDNTEDDNQVAANNDVGSLPSSSQSSLVTEENDNNYGNLAANNDVSFPPFSHQVD